DRSRGGHEQERIAVGWRGNHVLDRNVRARPWPVLDVHLLAEALAEPRRHDARDDVGAAAGRESHHPADRPRRPGFRMDRAGPRERGRPRGKMQEPAAWNACRGHAGSPPARVASQEPLPSLMWPRGRVARSLAASIAQFALTYGSPARFRREARTVRRLP